jgi:hypothetical protein
MADEAARHDLRQALTSAIGAEQAATLMEQLPPVPWDRLLFFSTLGAILTTASLAFAAARF